MAWSAKDLKRKRICKCTKFKKETEECILQHTFSAKTLAHTKFLCITKRQGPERCEDGKTNLVILKRNAMVANTWRSRLLCEMNDDTFMTLGGVGGITVQIKP